MSTDFSDVKWPWDDHPNWAAPRERATSDPGDNENWVMECHECALRFPSDIKMGVVAEHYQELHEGSGEEAHLNLVWVGLGVPPESNPLS